MAIFYKNIGQTYRLIKKYDEAIEYLTKAYEIQHQLKNTQQEVWILTNIGASYSNKREHAKALPYYEQSLELARRIGNPLMVINNLNQIGQNYISQSQYIEAEKYLLKAYQESEKYGKNSHRIYVIGSLSSVYFELGKLQKSIKTVRDKNKPATLIIEQTINTAGLKPSASKIESSGKNGARVVLNEASFNQILIWLNTLATYNGIQVVSANIERAKTPGRANARLTLERL